MSRAPSTSPELLPLAQLLARYLEARSTPPERTTTLLKYAEELFRNE
jgi:hypothetical protein